MRGGARRSSICWIAWASRSIARRKACSISAALAARSINRTAFAGATTGQQLLYALDEQVRRYEAEGKVKKYEHWEFLVGGSRCATASAAASAPWICAPWKFAPSRPTRSSWPPAASARSSASPRTLSSAPVGAVGALPAGRYYANGEFIQVHPTAIPGEDKLRLMSESARGEGGRVWVPKTPGDKRDPKSHSRSRALVLPGRVVSEIRQPGAARCGHARHFQVVYEHNLGIDGKPMVYLDLTHIDRKTLDRKLEGILEIYEKFVGDDPRDRPMKIFPGMHYTMGGMWVDFDQCHEHSGNLRRG